MTAVIDFFNLHGINIMGMRKFTLEICVYLNEQTHDEDNEPIVLHTYSVACKLFKISERDFRLSLVVACCYIILKNQIIEVIFFKNNELYVLLQTMIIMKIF